MRPTTNALRLSLASALLLAALPALAQSTPDQATPDRTAQDRTTPDQIAPVDASQCAKLQQLSLDNAHVISAAVVAAGGFTVPPGPNGKAEQLPLYSHLPAFCRAVVEATPTPDSQIRIEVWLPVAGWNVRLQGQGNGGFAGSIDYRALAFSLVNGFATAGTDTGHFADGINADWALGHPEKVKDFGWRGIHQMTVQAKAVLTAYYQSPAKHNYFASCSDGGREALMEAQRFPADYDGIIAGAPAYAWTRLVTGGAMGMQTLLSDKASYIPSSKVPLIAQSIVAACDKIDGLKDGLVSEPQRCHFDAATIACKKGMTDSCLTAPQVKALNTLFSDRKVGDTTLPGFLRTGGEEDPNGWPSWVTGSEPGKSAGVGFATGYFGNMVYGDRHWNFRTFDPVQGLAEARAKTGSALDAADTDLSAFHNRGGKLILFHGWADAAISPLYTIAYYEGVQQKLGKDEAASFTRLYMLPGVKHCAEGPGPDSIGQFGLLGPKSTAQDNAFRALEDWVEQGTSPGPIIAAKYAKPLDPTITLMTRPACPYPQEARYKGTGSIKSADSFVCR